MGEGNVGKCSLVAVLHGEPFVSNRSTTHGIEITQLELPRPSRDEPITLNTWDFGGQEVYRITLGMPNETNFSVDNSMSQMITKRELDVTLVANKVAAGFRLLVGVAAVLSVGVASVRVVPPSRLHESVVELFRSRPGLVVELLADVLGYAVPEHAQARLASNDLSDYQPTEYRADAVVTLTDAAGTPVLAVVVEAQLRPDGDKRWSWPAYLANLQARLQCPVVLVVVCPTAEAGGCAVPHVTGHPGYVLWPLVVGPEQVAPITEVGQACRHPELAALALLAHPDHPEFERFFHTLVTALDQSNHEHAGLYTDMVLASASPAVRQRLEEFMATRTYEYQSNFARRYYTEGEAQGEARGRAEGEVRALLAILRARGIPVPEDIHIRITACTDLDQLDTWVHRAITATTIHDILDQ